MFCHQPAARPPRSRAQAVAGAGRHARSAVARDAGCPIDGSGGPHEFVVETAGDDAAAELLGMYLPKPRWRVRVATFEGDVADRAEEWRVVRHRDRASAATCEHTCPKGARARRSTKAAARARGAAAAEGASSASTWPAVRPAKSRRGRRSARRGPTGSSPTRTRRIAAAAAGRAAHRRRARRRRTGAACALRVRAGRVGAPAARRRHAQPHRPDHRRRRLRRTAASSAAVGGVVAWSRRKYAPRLFLAAAAIMLVVTLRVGDQRVAGDAGDHADRDSARDSDPRRHRRRARRPRHHLQPRGSGARRAAGATGRLEHASRPRRAAPRRRRRSVRRGTTRRSQASLRTPEWARNHQHRRAWDRLSRRWPSHSIRSPAFLTRAAVLLSLLVSVHHVTLGWTRRRALAGASVALVGFLGAGAPAGSELAGWIAAGLLLAAGLLVAYATLLRADLTIDPDRARHDDGDRRADARRRTARFRERYPARSPPPC